MTLVDNRNFYVYRYERELNDIPNAVVIISYPENAFGEAKALRVFLSTNAGLSTQEILDSYTRRWPIEIFFRQSKTKLALDKYQIRTQTGIERYWLIMSLVHYMCCTYNGSYCSFEEGYQHFQRKIREEQITALYQSIRHGMSLEDVLKLAG